MRGVFAPTIQVLTGLRFLMGPGAELVVAAATVGIDDWAVAQQAGYGDEWRDSLNVFTFRSPLPI